jgi:hypothetical protein
MDNIGKPGRSFQQDSNALTQFKRMLPAMNTPSPQSPDASQTKFPSASDCLSGNQTRMDSRSSIPGPIDLQVEGTDDDSDLIALGRQLEEIAAKVRKLCNSASANDHVEAIEAMLGRLEPVERAIMATPARTVAGLGVKARHAAYAMSEYWDAPIDKIDWDARAVRLLIEAVCESAGLSSPFCGDDEKTPAAD